MSQIFDTQHVLRSTSYCHWKRLKACICGKREKIEKRFLKFKVKKLYCYYSIFWKQKFFKDFLKRKKTFYKILRENFSLFDSVASSFIWITFKNQILLCTSLVVEFDNMFFWMQLEKFIFVSICKQEYCIYKNVFKCLD